MKIESMQFPNYDLVAEMIEKQNSYLNKQMDEITIEGLRRKGFEFKNNFELGKFIKERCSIQDYTHKKERIYFIDESPFLIHYYKFSLDVKRISKDRTDVLTANAGSFRYL